MMKQEVSMAIFLVKILTALGFLLKKMEKKKGILNAFVLKAQHPIGKCFHHVQKTP